MSGRGAMAGLALEGRVRMRIPASLVELVRMTALAVVIPSVRELRKVLRAEAQKLHTGSVRVVALGAFKTGVVSLGVDAGDRRPSARRILQLAVASQAERPCRVDHELRRAAWMLQCGTVAVLALDDHMRIRGHLVEHVLMTGLAGFIPLVLDRDLLPVLDGTCSIQSVRESISLYAEILWDIEVSEYEENDDLSLIHISEPTRLGMISYAVFCLKK